MDDRISITLCGDGGCGKSSITLRVVRGQWVHEYDPTIEDSYSVTRTIDGTTYSLAITDTAGQEEYRGMWSSANLSSDAFLLVYDITSSESLHALDHYSELIEMECESRAEAGRCWPAVMVAGNKCDLQASRQVGAREGLEWAWPKGYGFMETSAREMVNIEETFAALVKRVAEARRMHASGLKPVPPPAAAVVQTPQPQQSMQEAPTSISTEKPAPTQPIRENQNAPSTGKTGFWSNLKCW